MLISRVAYVVIPDRSKPGLILLWVTHAWIQVCDLYIGQIA